MVAEMVAGHSHHFSWLSHQVVPEFRFTGEHEYMLQSSAGGPPLPQRLTDPMWKKMALREKLGLLLSPAHLRYHSTSTNHRPPCDRTLNPTQRQVFRRADTRRWAQVLLSGPGTPESLPVVRRSRGDFQGLLQLCLRALQTTFLSGGLTFCYCHHQDTICSFLYTMFMSRLRKTIIAKWRVPQLRARLKTRFKSHCFFSFLTFFSIFFLEMFVLCDIYI